MPGSADVQRLLLQVDASVELARRNMKELANAVDNDAANMDKALGKVENAHKRLGTQLGKTGQFRGGMQQLSFQIGDVSQQLALGTKTSTIFAQQSGQVIQAIQLMNTGTSGFLKFLAGPWGVVLTTAGVILATFAGRLFESKDAVGQLVDKMRDQAAQARLNEQANKVWERSLDGIIEKTRKLREEQQKALDTDREQQQRQLTDLGGQNKSATNAIPGLQRQLADAQRALRDAQSQFNLVRSLGPGPDGENRGALALAGTRVDAARAKVTNLITELGKAHKAVTDTGDAIAQLEILIARGDAKAISDPIEAIRRKYEDLRREAEKAARANDKLRASLKGTLAGYDTREAAEIKAANEQDKEGGGTAIFNAQIGQYLDTANQFRGRSEHSAVDRGVLESFFREANLNLDPEKVKWCAAFVNAVLATNGVTGTGSLAAKSFLNFGKDDTKSPQKGDIVVVSKGGQDHVGFVQSIDKKGNVQVLGGNTGDKVGTATYSKSQILAIRRPPTPAENADLANKASLKAQNQDDAFATQMAQLQQQTLAAQMDLVTSITAQADFAKQQVDLEQHRYEAGVENDVHDGRLREEQGKLLIEKSQAVSIQKKANIDARAEVQKLEDQQRTKDQEIGFQLEGLRYADEIAKTQAEHRRIQLQIIDALYEQREADLRLAKAKAEAAQNAEEAARIQAQIDQLPTQKGRDQDRTARGTRSPYDEWADKVPQTAEEMSQFFDQLKVQGIDGAIDSIMALGEGFDSFRQTAINAIKAVIAELLRMQLMKLALNIFGAAAGGGFGGGGAGSAVSLGGSAPLSSMGGGLDLGMVSSLPHLAGGGIMSVGGRGGRDRNLLSLNGVPRAMVDASEKLAVIPRVGVPKPANSNTPGDAGGGHTFNIYVTAPNTGDPVRDKASAMQSASAVRREVARAGER